MNISKSKYNLYKNILKIRPTILLAGFKNLISWPRQIIKTKHGYFWIDTLSAMGLGIVSENFEIHSQRTIDRLLNKGDTFIDIGANEGFFSMMAGNKVGAEGIVLSIEPQKRLINVIEINKRLNKLDNISILNIAVSDSNGEKDIWLSPTTVTGSTSIVRSYFKSKPQKVKTKTLEKVFDEFSLDNIKLVKIDVEGFEPEVLYGASKLLQKNRIKYVYVDIHLSILKDRKIDPLDINKYMNQHNYCTVDEKFTASGYNLYEYK